VDDLRGDELNLVRLALGDLAVDLSTIDLSNALGSAESLPDTDRLRESLPRLAPSLSEAVIADRDEHV
jgi:hypothetical protein